MRPDPAVRPRASQMARALVVDSHEDARRAATRALARVATHRVFTHHAATVDEAAGFLRRDPFHVVVAAARVNGASGAELLARVARDQPGARRILLVGEGDLDLAAQAINGARVDAMLRSPVDEAALHELTERLLAPRPKTAPAPPPGEPDAAVEEEIRRLTQEVNRLKVRRALGSVSEDAYERTMADLTRQRADAEGKLLARRPI